jgi:hypothetical protein
MTAKEKREITLREHMSRISKLRWSRMTKEERSALGTARINKRWAKVKKDAEAGGGSE